MVLKKQVFPITPEPHQLRDSDHFASLEGATQGSNLQGRIHNRVLLYPK